MADTNESRQIEILRVLCITCMMWVHVNPGTSTLSVVNSGAYAQLGWFLADVLGRTSVSTLSFISGYLLWNGHLQRPFHDFVSRQFRNIVVPMIVWGSIFLLLALLKDFAHSRPSVLTHLAVSPLGFLDAVFGISGPTANQSLFFLRDLFVSSLLLKLMLPAIRRVPLLTAALVTLVAAHGEIAPLIFRPTILLFLTLGAVAARRGQTIANLSRLRVAVPSAVVIAAVFVAVEMMTTQSLAQSPEIVGILRRLGLAMMALAVSGLLVRKLHFVRLAPIGRHMYLCYLAHLPVMGIAWTIWTATVGGPMDDSYVLFFVMAPIACVMLAAAAGPLLDHAPVLAQRLLRGKVHTLRNVTEGNRRPHAALSTRATSGI